jgi:Zn ribbon nucleic-acid-binding protein
MKTDDPYAIQRCTKCGHYGTIKEEDDVKVRECHVCGTVEELSK